MTPEPFTTCPWLVLVRSGNPEPDSPADLWCEVECGAPVRWLPGAGDYAGWECEAGHHHYGLEIELRLEAEREEAERRGHRS